MKKLKQIVDFVKHNKHMVFVAFFALITLFLSFFWQFWMLFGVVFWAAAVLYFSKGLRDILNIHVVVLGLIALLAVPSTVLILSGEILLDSDESLALFSSIVIGLIGYTCGVLLLRSQFVFDKRNDTRVSRGLNALFALTYKYRYILTFICSAVLVVLGFLPMRVSYLESISYRAATPGVVLYFTSLIPAVFSPLLLAMIVIIGDFQRLKRLSWLSYLLIILVIVSIIGGYRIWIIGLCACLMLTFQPVIKSRNMLLMIVLAVFLFFILSGGVRYARMGQSINENIVNFSVYFSNMGNMSFTDVVWGWSDFTAPFSTFITLVKNIPYHIGFDYTLPMKDLSLLIPTVIYPERPLPPSIWYVQTFEPELFARGEGLTFYAIGVGYLFAGPIGVFLYLFTFGALFEWLAKVFKMVGGAAGLFLYSFFFMELLSFVRGDGLIAFIKGSFLNVVIPIFLLFLFVLFSDLFRFKQTETAK